MNVELIVDTENRVFPIDIGPRNGGNMIPDLLGMIFDCDVVEMSIKMAMGESVDYKSCKGKSCFATLNLHSDKNGTFEEIRISPEIEKRIVRKVIYAKRGDEVRRFNNAADALGIVFFKFDDYEEMINAEGKMNEYIEIVLQ